MVIFTSLDELRTTCQRNERGFIMFVAPLNTSITEVDMSNPDIEITVGPNTKGVRDYFTMPCQGETIRFCDGYMESIVLPVVLAES